MWCFLYSSMAATLTEQPSPQAKPEQERLTDSRRATIGAERVYEAFRTYRNKFETVTALAQRRFERRDWQGWRTDSAHRLSLRKEAVAKIVAEIQDLLGERLHDKMLWMGLKAVFSSHISYAPDWELAETFFNSLTRRIFTTVGVDEQIEFVRTDFSEPPTPATAQAFRRYSCADLGPNCVATAVTHILRDVPIESTCEDIVRDAERVAKRLQEVAGGEIRHLDIASEVFYRGKAAYLVGRAVTKNGRVPIALALLHEPDGLVIDALISGEDCVGVLFSYTHSYFHVAAARPFDLVRFLRELLPHKKLSELYIALGYHKHGKTEMYRELLAHLESDETRDKHAFELAPGIPGMVMTVFTAQDYDLVFKLIRDRFDPPKDTSREKIRGRYDLVFHHDRAGRLIDAQEFEHLAFDKHHFSPELLETLTELASKTLEVADQEVITKHLYMERRVTPLNLYFDEATREESEAAVVEYGQAIKDLAYSNIFPGDMLVKNFGVTRLGRVVFYDYDELCLLETCNFRRVPEPKTHEQEMASEPWYYVGPDDVFPEQLLPFLGIPKPLRPAFVKAHGDLLEPKFWQKIQERLAEGEFISILPYGERSRLR